MADYRFVYVWVDGVHIKAGVARKNVAVLTVSGVDVAGRKHLMALEEGYRESKENWLGVLRNLRDRGMKAPVLAVDDGALDFCCLARTPGPTPRASAAGSTRWVTCSISRR